MDTLELANRLVSTVPPRQTAAKRLRNLAVKSEGDHPETHVHEHLRDAAAALDSGNTHAALRHLGGAAHTLTPVSLIRHGITDDAGHSLAKQNLGAIDRQILMIKQIQDTEAQNAAIQERKAQESLEEAQQRAARVAARTGVLPPPNPFGAGPAAGQPGSVESTKPSVSTTGAAEPASAATPAAKAPGSPATAKAPDARTGQQLPNAKPAAAQKPMVTKPPAGARPAAKAASMSQLLRAIELAGPKGYTHGWVFHGTPGGNEHANALSELGERMASKSPTAALSMRHAADRVNLGQYKLAAGHIKNAQWFARRQAPEFNSDLRKAAGSVKPLVARENPLATKNMPTRTVTGREPRNWLGSKAPSDLQNFIAIPRRSISTVKLQGTSLSSLMRAIELSAQTASLVATPAPYGKPGGPGLYGVAGQKHSNYFEHIVQAMLRSGKTKAEASKIAWGALKRWSAGGGHVTPEVQAAATSALAEEEGKAKSAKLAWGRVLYAIELSTTTGAGGKAGGGGQPKSQAKSQKAENQPRVPAGQLGAGQFGTGKGDVPVKGAKGKPALGNSKADLEQKAKNDRARARALEGTLTRLLAQQKTMAAQTAQATKAGSTGKSASSTPAKTAQATTSSNPAAAAASSSAPAAAGAKAPSAKASATSLATQITAVRGQIKILLDAASAASAAAKTAK